MAFVVSAIATAFEVGTVAAALTAVSYVGIATTVVGAVTGNKNLMKIGGELGLVGGIGGLVSGAISGAASAAGDLAAGGGADVASEGIDAATSATEGAVGGLDAGTGIAQNDLSAIQGANSAAESTLPGLSGTDQAANLSNTSPDISTSAATTQAPSTGIIDNITNSPTASVPAPAVTSPVTAPPSLQTTPLNPDGTSTGATPDVTTAQPIQAAPANPVIPQTTTGNQFAPDSPSSTANFNDRRFDTATGIGDNSATGAGSAYSPTAWDKISSQWDSFSPTTKAELLKAGLSIPSGIQNQRNAAAQRDLVQQQINQNQQRINQTSHGSEIPVFGIINRARSK